MDISVNDFFKPIHLDSIPSEYDYGMVKYYTRLADALSQLLYHSIYLIDYYKRGFLYVSDNQLFLCGKSSRQVLDAGYSFYLKNVPAEDLQLLLKINEAGFRFYDKLPIDERTDYSISYDFHLRQPNEHLTLINHKLAPLILDKSGNIWIALCLVSLSSNNKSGNIFIKNAKEKKTFEYDTDLKKWNEEKVVRFNNQEKEILILSSQGFTVEGIAKELFLSVDTIKYHKKNLFRKLKANTISEAILSAVNTGVI